MSRQSSLFIYPFFLLLVILSSCSIAYTPNVINTPLLAEKGELRGAVHLGTSGIDLQASVAVSNHVGVMVNTSFTESSTNDQDSHKHTFIELGTGYFTKIGESGRFETFTGLGIANYSRNNENGAPFKGRFTRLFLQPTIGASSDIFHGSISPRLVLINFREGVDSGNFNKTAILIEPVITAKVGYKYAYFVLQGGFSFPLSDIDYHNSLIQPFIFNFGVQGNIDLKDFN